MRAEMTEMTTAVGGDAQFGGEASSRGKCRDDGGEIEEGVETGD